MRLSLISILLILFQYGWSQQVQYPYKNKKLSVEKRAADLLGRMTLHEKILQLQQLHDISSENLQEKMDGYSYGCAINIYLDAKKSIKTFTEVQKYIQNKTRLGIPALICSEGLHGTWQPGCTIYPQSIAIGSTFNPELIYRMASEVSEEFKAFGIHQVLSPDLDIARELRWGRVEETYGEDPFLNGIMGVNFVKGFQENGIVATPKHFVAHGSPQGGLNMASVEGNPRILRSLYAIPFEMVIKQANPLSLMNSYNSFEGIPVAASSNLLTKYLRKELGFKGFVYSDWNSVKWLYSFHNVADGTADAAKQAIMAGVDLEAASNCYLELEKLVNEKKLDLKYIDTAVYRILRVKFAIGLFENPFPSGDTTVVHNPKSIALAKEIADESIVLLKNSSNLLPLDITKYKSIALIGPNAGHVRFGDYTWTNAYNGDDKDGITPLQGMQNRIGNKVQINFAEGCDWWSQNKEGFPKAIEAVENSDIAIVVIGTYSVGLSCSGGMQSTSGEEFDLSDLNLPGVQSQLLEEVKKAGKPVVVVLVSGKPLSIPWVKDNADAILVQWYGGEQQGNALADVILGNVNPSGKLNVSFPKSVGHLPCFYNYLPTDRGHNKSFNTLEKPGSNYVFSSSDALWNFGYGLSYTSFNYIDAVVSKNEVKANDIITIDVKIKNTGNIDGKEVVQLYIRDVVSSVVTPLKQLKAFRKVLVKAGETQTVRLTLPINELFLYNRDMKRVVEPGEFELQIGASSDDIKFTKKINVLN